MWNRKELKDNAKRVLKSTYWESVAVAFFLMIAACGLIGINNLGNIGNIRDIHEIIQEGQDIPPVTFSYSFGIISFLVTLLLLNPFMVGCYNFFRNDIESSVANMNDIQKGFTVNYWNVVKIIFLRSLYIFLWSLLLIIPGIIKSYEYMMVPYIIAENPDIDSKEAFAMSKRMMEGQKWNAFILQLSFIGWGILTIMTCGILGVFYVNPYYYLTEAGLYSALKERGYIEIETVEAEILEDDSDVEENPEG